MNYLLKIVLVLFIGAICLIGCASLEKTPGPVKTESTIFVSLQQRGVYYLKQNPAYRETRGAILLNYKLTFAERWAGCESISLGLQLLSVTKSKSSSLFNLFPALLAESAKSEKDFTKKLNWYKNNLSNATFFLEVLIRDQRGLQSVKNNDLTSFEEFLKRVHLKPCAPKTTFQVLREYPYLL